MLCAPDNYSGHCVCWDTVYFSRNNRKGKYIVKGMRWQRNTCQRLSFYV